MRLQITGTSETDKRASLSTTTSSAFAFGTNSSERMRITSGGNVGIGTTSPAQILHLSSTTPVLRIDATAAYNASPTATLSFVGTYKKIER